MKQFVTLDNINEYKRLFNINYTLIKAESDFEEDIISFSAFRDVFRIRLGSLNYYAKGLKEDVDTTFNIFILKALKGELNENMHYNLPEIINLQTLIEENWEFYE